MKPTQTFPKKIQIADYRKMQIPLRVQIRFNGDNIVTILKYFCGCVWEKSGCKITL